VDSKTVWLALSLFGLAPATAGAGPDAPDGGPPRTGPFVFTPPARRNEGTYPLRPTPEGGYEYDDLRFRARIAPDGHVAFTDVRARLDRPSILGFPLDFTLKSRSGPNDARPSLAETMMKALRGDPHKPLPFTPHSRPRDAEKFWAIPPTPSLPMGPTFISISGTFDLTDELMRATGQGWYRYEKAKFLSATFEFRVKLAAERQRKWLRDAIAELPERLEALWRIAEYPPLEKRRILCLLWSELDVADPDHRQAAEVIVGWIRRRLPAGTPGGYSAAEQARCAAEANRPFAIYDAAPGARGSGP
jgi:hypothetical protein